MFDELIPSFVIGSANFGNPAFESSKKRQKPGVGKVSVTEMLLQNPVTATFLPSTLRLSLPPFQVKKILFLQNAKVRVCMYRAAAWEGNGVGFVLSDLTSVDLCCVSSEVSRVSGSQSEQGKRNPICG